MSQQAYRTVNGRLGAPAYGDDAIIVSRTYPDEQEEWTVTVGGTTSNGIYSFDLIDLPDDIGDISASFDRQAAETDAQIAAALLADLQTNDDFNALFTGSVAGAVITIVMRETGVAFQVANEVAPGTATLVGAQSVDSDLADLALGLGVVRTGTDTNIRVPTGTDTADDIEGIVVRGNTGIKTLPADGSGRLAGNDDGYSAPAQVSVLKQGAYWVEAEVAVVVGEPVFVRIGGTGTVGALRNDADGGNAVQIPGTWETGAAAGALAVVRVNLP